MWMSFLKNTQEIFKISIPIIISPINMIELFKNTEEKKSFISTHSDPFKSDKIELIRFNIRNSSWWTNGKTTYTSYIDFKNGNTTGSHTIEAPDFVSLIQQTETFIKNL